MYFFMLRHLRGGDYEFEFVRSSNFQKKNRASLSLGVELQPNFGSSDRQLIAYIVYKKPSAMLYISYIY